jgi:large subunit ribosomal protein L28e
MPCYLSYGQDLLWLLVKDNNSFLVKRGRTARLGAVQFSEEPSNLLNVNSFKYSAIANAQSIVMEATTAGVTGSSLSS